MQNSDHINKICLDIFARVTAAVSHEIKNTLSIINENAGLLEDLSAMADGEVGIPSARVEAATKTIMKQVVRSNTIMKNLNSFAHSGDAPVSRVALGGIISLMVELTGRQAAMKKIVVNVKVPDDLMIESNLSLLESLLYLALSYIYRGSKEGSVITVVAEKSAPNIVIRLGIEGEDIGIAEHFPGRQEELLAKQIGASCKRESDAVCIVLPV